MEYQQSAPTQAPRSSSQQAGGQQFPAVQSTGPSRTGAGNAASVDKAALGTAITGSNPAGYTDGQGNATKDDAVDMTDGFNAQARPDPFAVCREADVHILHGEDGPLELSGEPSSESQLYEELPPTRTSSASGDTQTVSAFVGDIANPYVSQKLDPSSVFVGTGPTVADVHQGMVGDCYFLAVLGDVVSADPGQIAGMISASGNSFSIRLHRFDSSSNAWVPVVISVDDQLAQFTTNTGQETGLVGSSFRIASDPSYAKWYAKFHGTTLGVHQDSYYKAAIWAPLVEKAFARYAERFGQYGGAFTGDQHAQTDDNGAALSGYKQIDGGSADLVYNVIYGAAVQAHDTDDIQYAPGGDAVGTNRLLIENLLRVQGEGVPEGQTFMMTMGCDTDEAVARLDAQTASTLARPDMDNHPSFARELQFLRSRISAWRGEGDATKKGVLLEKVAKEAGALVTPGNWPILQSNQGGGDYKDLAELLSMVMNASIDHGGTGPLHTYASHSYSVLGATFLDAQGAAVSANFANLDTTLSQIDPLKSSVQLRNPHGTNEPDMEGDGPADHQDDGVFSLNLEQVSRSFNFHQHGLVRT